MTGDKAFAPRISIETTVSLASENGPTSGDFRITRTGSLAGDLSVNLQITGPAVNGSDYRFVPTAITLPAGERSVTIQITPYVDAITESAEIVDIAIISGSGYEVASQGDRAQLSQLLHNLIGHSIKYGRAGSPIRVSLSDGPNGLLRLTVADEGEGIGPDHLPRLTERFYRVESGRSRAVGGTGLGLAIVKHIVERHRGRLDIASVLGKGTTISILLPRFAVEEKALAAKA